MKKSILALALIGMIVLAGCSNSNESESFEESSVETTESSSSQVVESSEEEKEDEDEISEHLVVADAAMYRGTIESIVEDGDITTVVLTQPVGINFGAPTVTFTFDTDTRLSFDETELVDGAFIEVYYGAAMGEPTNYSETIGAIAVNKYMDADMTNYNGEIIDLTKDVENPANGAITLKTLDSDDIIVFNYGDESSLYLNVDELVVGDKLNVFHSGALAMSMPAQGYIIEARNYFEAAGVGDEVEANTSVEQGQLGQPPLTGAIA